MHCATVVERENSQVGRGWGVKTRTAPATQTALCAHSGPQAGGERPGAAVFGKHVRVNAHPSEPDASAAPGLRGPRRVCVFQGARHKQRHWGTSGIRNQLRANPAPPRPQGRGGTPARQAGDSARRPGGGVRRRGERESGAARRALPVRCTPPSTARAPQPASVPGPAPRCPLAVPGTAARWDGAGALPSSPAGLQLAEPREPPPELLLAAEL